MLTGEIFCGVDTISFAVGDAALGSDEVMTLYISIRKLY
jgi:hypothetical protein